MRLLGARYRIITCDHWWSKRFQDASQDLYTLILMGIACAEICTYEGEDSHILNFQKSDSIYIRPVTHCMGPVFLRDVPTATQVRLCHRAQHQPS